MTQVLTGDGGVGKTQLAVDAWAALTVPSGSDIPSTIDFALWVTASSRAGLFAGYSTASVLLGLTTTSDQQVASETFLSWLATTTRAWLIVLDDVTDPADLAGLWPVSSRALPTAGGITRTSRLIITTRLRDQALFGHQRQRIDVGLFAPEDSVDYLLKRLKRSVLPMAEIGLESVGKLADDLVHLPLALAQASAYILNEKVSVPEYRTILSDRRERLSDLLPADSGDDHERTVEATWSLSMDRASALIPTGIAHKMARIISVLDPSGIPEVVLTSQAVGVYLQSGGLSPREARRALLNLDRFSVISHDAASANRTVQMHALAQRATREQGPVEEIRKAIEIAADAILQVWPKFDSDTPLTEALHSSATILVSHENGHLWSLGMHPLLLRMSGSMGGLGLVTEAMDLCSKIVRNSTNILGFDHPETLAARHQHAYWQGEGGDPAAAADEFQAVYQDRLRILGPDHADTLTALSRFALMSGQAGDAVGATNLFEDLLERRSRILGPDHTDSLRARHDLAYWRGGSGNPEEAVRAFESLLEDRLALLGPDHHETLQTRSHLALFRGEAGNSIRAIREFKSLLVDRQRVFGADHPASLATEINIARWTGESGDASAAVRQLESLLIRQRATLGPSHPHFLNARREIACWRGEAGAITRAVTELKDLLSEQIAILGPDHLHTLATRDNHASWVGESGKAREAVDLLVELVMDKARVMGRNHPDSLRTRVNLAHWRGHVGDVSSAVTDFEELLEVYRTTYQEDHPYILEIKRHIAWWPGTTGDARTAAKSFADLYQVHVKVLGENHPRTLEVRKNIWHWMAQSGEIDRAVVELEKLATDESRVLGVNHPTVVSTRDEIRYWRALL